MCGPSQGVEYGVSIREFGKGLKDKLLSAAVVEVQWPGWNELCHCPYQDSYRAIRKHPPQIVGRFRCEPIVAGMLPLQRCQACQSNSTQLRDKNSTSSVQSQRPLL